MRIKKIISVFIVSFFIASIASAAIKIDGKFKNWESHYTEDGKIKYVLQYQCQLKKSHPI